MEAQTALVGSDGAVELDAIAVVHLNLTLVVHPRNPEQNGALGLSVADTGPGIADKERAFQKFYRADPQTGDASLGLGLSIAQKLVALHHGSITIRDTPGGGATLQVTIPQA